jgi:hypothetical protein
VEHRPTSWTWVYFFGFVSFDSVFSVHRELVSMQSDPSVTASTSQVASTSSEAASSANSKDLIGYGIIAVLAILFLFMVRSILLSKKAISLPVEGELDQAGKVDSSVTTAVTLPEDESVEDVSSESTLERPRTVVTPAVKSDKPKGLKGKKKLQKKKLKAQQIRETAVVAKSPAVVEPAEVVARSESIVIRESTEKIFIPAVVVGNDSAASTDAKSSIESSVIEPVLSASTHAINAMATRAKTVKSEKPKADKVASAKNAAVQGFHKMDRYAEPQRVFASQELTQVIQRVDRQVAAMGDEPSSKSEQAPKPKRNQRPVAAKPVVAEANAEGPRTLKDFLSKKGNQES